MQAARRLLPAVLRSGGHQATRVSGCSASFHSLGLQGDDAGLMGDSCLNSGSGLTLGTGFRCVDQQPLPAYQLLAVPKRKVTPSRKKQRATHKHWKPVPVVAQCSLCSRVMKAHEVPHKCKDNDCPSLLYSRSSAGAAEPQATTP
mmetsp:Transcript_18546/g.51946  ORF Transcript_18546/g.51946 Transcript_18546/m.51946 type:complete len:145 (+) Transcript_18546:66-500(+)